MAVEGETVVATAPGKPPGEPATEAPMARVPGRARDGLWFGCEALTSLLVAGVFLLWSGDIVVDPLDRKGQVSGLAALQFRFAVVAAVLVIGLLLAHRWLGVHGRERAVALGCAAVAGLTTGLVAGGIDVALRGTQFGLWAGGGDYAWILDWTARLDRGEQIPHHYPPLIFLVISAIAEITDQPLIFALKEMQLVGTALFGPGAYLAWRSILRPVWALGIGVVAMLPFIEPVKPYPQITLVVMIPVIVRYLQIVRRAADLTALRAVLTGAGFGAGLGLLFLLYSGWFVWCVGGVIVAFCVVTPWRGGWRQTLLLSSSTLVTFVVLTWWHLTGVLAPTGATSDNFFYFDTDTEPAYIAMWRNDKPADVGSVWPPTGELAGVGLFTIVLTIGLAVALWLGWRRTCVITIGLGAASAWFMRMWLASEQWETQTVRLYPRTTMVVLYALLLLTGFAIHYASRALRELYERGVPAPAETRCRASAVVPAGLMLIPLLFLFASAGSAFVNRYMPNERDQHPGYYAWIAQVKQHPDGTCSTWGRQHGCSPRTAKPKANSRRNAPATPRTGPTRRPTPNTAPS